jgi:hypothetical protein
MGPSQVLSPVQTPYYSALSPSPSVPVNPPQLTANAAKPVPNTSSHPVALAQFVNTELQAHVVNVALVQKDIYDVILNDYSFCVPDHSMDLHTREVCLGLANQLFASIPSDFQRTQQTRIYSGTAGVRYTTSYEPIGHGTGNAELGIAIDQAIFLDNLQARLVHYLQTRHILNLAYHDFADKFEISQSEQYYTTIIEHLNGDIQHQINNFNQLMHKLKSKIYSLDQLVVFLFDNSLFDWALELIHCGITFTDKLVAHGIQVQAPAPLQSSTDPVSAAVTLAPHTQGYSSGVPLAFFCLQTAQVIIFNSRTNLAGHQQLNPAALLPQTSPLMSA